LETLRLNAGGLGQKPRNRKEVETQAEGSKKCRRNKWTPCVEEQQVKLDRQIEEDICFGKKG